MKFPKVKLLAGCAAILFFSLIWCGVTGFFDWMLIRGAIRQWQAMDHPTETGTVISSQVVNGRKGSSRAEIVTQFTVAGKTHETRQWRHRDWGSAHSADTQRIVDRHPAGSHPTVYYVPNAPTDAILEPGLMGDDAFLLLFLTPFNLVGIQILGIYAVLVRQACILYKTGNVSKASVRNLRTGLRYVWLEAALENGRAFRILFIGPILSVFVLLLTGLKDVSFWIPFGLWIAFVATAIALFKYGRPNHPQNKIVRRRAR